MSHNRNSQNKVGSAIRYKYTKAHAVCINPNRRMLARIPESFMYLRLFLGVDLIEVKDCRVAHL